MHIIPKITVITATYNSSKTLEYAILSVINQTFKNIEYIIIDGKSTDGTINILKKYNKYLKWISEEDSGIYDALNKGISLARGEFIYILGSDDCLVNEKVFEDISLYLTDDTDIVSGTVWIIDEKNSLQKEYDNKINFKRLHEGYNIPHQGMFVKTKLLKKYNFDCGYRIVADYDLFLKMYLNKQIKFKFIDNKIAFYSNFGESSLKIIERKYEKDLVMKKHKINFKKKQIGDREIYIKYKVLLKKILYKFFAIYFIRKIKGWKKHECSLEFCRWCDRSLY